MPWVVIVGWALLDMAVNHSYAVASDDLPALREGLWEYQRTVQRSDEDWSPKDTTVRECGSPTTVMETQNAVYRKLGCAIVTTRVTETAYQMKADCPTKNGIKTESRGVTTFDGDSAYTSVIDSEGPVAGKLVKFVERLSAKRVGDCEKK
jgi:uncharacterized protein DUF3617